MPLVHVGSLSQTSPWVAVGSSSWLKRSLLGLSPFSPQALSIFLYLVDSGRPVLASRLWFPDLLDLAFTLSVPFPLRPRLLSHPCSQHRHRGLLRLRFHTWRLQRFARAAGFSSRFAAQVGLAWRSSSRAFSRLGDLCLASGPGQHDLVRSFRIEAPFGRSVLRHGISLRCSSFLTHPSLICSTVSLRRLTKKVLFLVSLAIAKRVDEVQTVSRTVSFGRHDASRLCAGVCYQDDVLFLSPSLLFLGGFLVGFCGWVGRGTAAVTVRTLRLSSD